MSAECDACGTDLPYDGECVPCGLRTRISELEKERDEALAKAEWEA